MSETSFDYTEVVAAPLDAVWAAMQRTSELDVLGGQAVIERTSDADWTCQLEGDKHTTHCTAAYDKAAHTVTVTLDSTAKRVNDTTVITAAPAEGGTEVHVTSTIRGGAIVAGMLKLVGKIGVQGTNKAIVRNIAALATGGEAHVMTSDEVSAIAHERLTELKDSMSKSNSK